MERCLVVGLGNPGSEYEGTRHNAGFVAIDLLAERAAVRYWKTEGGSLTAKGKLGGTEVVLAKPQSFMNLSGGPVKKLLEAYDLSPEELIVIHDELDIPAGTVRAKLGGGHAGHNGLRSICDKLGTRDWYRVRTGIGRPPGRMDPADYVLSRPKGDAAADFQAACSLAADTAEALVCEGLEEARRVAGN